MLRRFVIFLSVLAGLLLSCTSTPVKDGGPVEGNEASRRAHDEVLEILRTRNNARRPASAPNDLAARLGDLGRLRPGRFEVYVFPKVKNQAIKDARASEEFLGAPQVFEVSVVALSPCKEFAKGRLFAKIRPSDVFQVPQNDEKKNCAIIEVTSRKLRTLNRALIQRDDLLQTRIFLDDDYRNHGYDYAIYSDTRNIRGVRTKNNLAVPASSGLTLFPIDLPSRDSRVYPMDPGDALAQRLDRVALEQVQRKFNRGFRIPSCNGAVFDSRDAAGSPVSIGWCKGMPWAHFIENSRFIAVTQPMALR